MLALIHNAERVAWEPADCANLQAEDLDDGGMGSIRLWSVGEQPGNEDLLAVADLWFKDTDGVAVLATLFLDPRGAPREIDVWKVDFSPLQGSKFPTPKE